VPVRLSIPWMSFESLRSISGDAAGAAAGVGAAAVAGAGVGTGAASAETPFVLFEAPKLIRSASLGSVAGVASGVGLCGGIWFFADGFWPGMTG
jgi:hypothetical protein